METTSAARLGLAVVYSGTSNFVRAFQIEAASAACLGIAVWVYFRCHVYSDTTNFVRVFQMEPDTAARLGFPAVYSGIPDSVRVFQTKAVSAACLGLDVFTYNHLDGVLTF